MPAGVLFTDKPLRLGVVAALATLTVLPTEAILLPPKPLALSSTWDCQAGPNSDWVCRTNQTTDYNQPLERVSSQTTQTESYSKPSSSSYPADPLEYSVQPRERQFEPRTEPEPYQPVSEVNSELESLEQLLNAPHGSFALQWLAAHTTEPLKELQQTYPVLGSATIVQYRRKNKLWYVLLDGPFDSRKDANQALNQAPRSLLANRLYPWTRSIASIQKLDLIRPDELIQPSGLEEQRLAKEYDYPSSTQGNSEHLFASIAPAYPKVEPSYREEPEQDSRHYTSKPAYEERRYDESRYSESRYDEPRYEEPVFSEHRYEEMDQNYAYQEQAYTRKERPESRYRKSYRDSRHSTYSHQERSGRYRFKERDRSRKPDHQSRPEVARRSILEAPNGSYTIQWLASTRKEALERTQRRFSNLRNAQIVHYRKRNKDWYVLVSEVYLSKTLAQNALNQPAFARISTRLYPRVRAVSTLKKLIAGKIQKPQPQTISARKADPLDTILKSPENSYTIQWFAANRPEAIEKMKQRFPELKSATTAHYRKNDKDWYVLLQGQFNSSRDALSTIKSPQLKDAVRILHPWTRPVKSLKNLDIQGTRG